MPGTETVNPIKFGYTDKAELPKEFTDNYPSYIVLNTKTNSIMFRDYATSVTGEIPGCNMESLAEITGNEPVWNADLGHVTA